MRSVNIHHAKTHLSRLVEEAAKGEPFIIAKAGRPMVKVVAVEPVVADPKDHPRLRLIGSMKGQFEIPDDFDTMMQEEIERMFYDGPLEP
jgi:prevent-host-death family protein